jgi:SAM-dependent methyltransferase
MAIPTKPPGPFEEAYAGTPPWDIGRPQPELIRLAEAGAIKGAVLDVGCGTGENALYLAGLKLEVWGVDSAPSAIRKAQDKAKARGLAARFVVHDALDLGSLGRTFDSVVDSGLFHVFSDAERPLFALSLAAVIRPGGTYFMLCFSERETGAGGPRRVSQAEIRTTFGPPWRIDFIRAARFASHVDDEGRWAWLSSITRV